MNKLLTKIASAVAGLAMVVGVGFAIASNNRAAKPVDATYNEGTAAEASWNGTYSNEIILWNFQNKMQIKQEKGTGQTAPNSSYTSAPRWYTGNKITITPARYMSIHGLQIKTTTTSYASTLKDSTYTNATATVNSDVVTITSTDPTQPITIAMGGQSRITGSLKYWYTDNTPVFGTLDHIKVTTLPTKTEFEVGETFNCDGLVLTGYDNADESIASIETYTEGYTTDYNNHFFLSEDLGQKVVTVTYSGKTATYNINVVKAPDIIHTYASNSVYSQTTGSSSEVRTYAPEEGPEYINLGGYNYSGNGGCMSFLNATGLYLGNNEEYTIGGQQRYINKIVITTYEDDSTKLTMTEGTSVLPSENPITPTLRDDNKTLVYLFDSTSSFFKLSKSTTSYVNLTSIKVYLGEVIYAKDIIAREVSTGSSLSYTNYSKSGEAVVDTVNRAFTGIADGSGYGSWSNKTGTSGAIYAGQSAGGNNSIQLRSNNNNSGVVTTASGGYAKKITVAWNASTESGRTLMVFGKNTPYSAATDLYANETVGTSLGTIVKGTSTTLSITGDYAYIGLRSNSGAMYINSISIQWGEVTYTYENLAVRFTGSVSEALWTRLNNESSIQGYGILLAEYDTIKDNDPELKNWLEYADLYDNDDLKNFTNANTVHDPAEKVTPTLKDGNYVWNLFKRVSLAKATTEYVAVAYIKLANDEFVFLQQERASVKSLAQDLIAAPDRDENSLGGSLNYLANL